MKRANLFRGGFYLGGLMLTALGSVLSAKAGLGVSATMAIPFAVTNVTGIKLSVTCFVVSSLMIVAQFLILGKDSRKRDWLQFPLNVLFGLFLEWFGNLFSLAPAALWQKIAVMVCSILSTGTGVFLMVNMRLVPNPPDGLTHVLSEKMGKELGITKNIVDFTLVATALLLDLLTGGKIISVGIGTVMAMVFIGRTVSLWNRFLRRSVLAAAGLK